MTRPTRQPTLNDHPPMPDRDPMRVFWFDLTAIQKEFIEARALTDTDAEAAAWIDLPTQTLMGWKRNSDAFQRVYNFLITQGDPNTMSQSLLSSRLVLLSGSAVEVIRGVFNTDEPSPSQIDKAKLAKDVLVGLARASSNKTRGRVDRSEGRQGPRSLDPEAITERALRAQMVADAEEEGDDAAS